MAEIIASTYVVQKELGSGGGGVVYLARHVRLGKNVVLKVNKVKASQIRFDPEMTRREVDVLKNLNCEFIPQVYDYYIQGDTVYTAMEYIQGESLDKPLKRGERFTQAQVIKWGKQLLKALAYLHSPTHGDPPKGYVHSDIKPANLMLTPEDDIRLIDFNISLALGEENIVGFTVGYASPEHYGIDYSAGGMELPKTVGTDGRTIGRTGRSSWLNALRMSISRQSNLPKTINGQGGAYSSSPKLIQKKIIPDNRSDIYMAGATLYHLLSGTRPAKDAVSVMPLSETEFSPLLVNIISKAMSPNPDMRYQSAEEMLEALEKLRFNDPRARAIRRRNAVVSALCATALTIGIASAFVGLKRIRNTDNALKLAEYSQNELADGNVKEAVSYAMKSLPAGPSLFSQGVLPEARKALTDALNVYDLSDGYQSYSVLDMISEPVCLELTPNGRTMACICSWVLYVIDTDSGAVLAELPTVESALAQVRFIDNDRIVFAGADGLTMYDLSKNEVLWSGDPATGIAISGDGQVVAAVYRDETHAVIYDTESGEKLKTVDFEGKRQTVRTSDLLADPHDNLFALNGDGSLLAVSFSDGTALICPLATNEDNWHFEPEMECSRFDGGFYGDYLAIATSMSDNSILTVIDTENMVPTDSFNSDRQYSVITNETGIYIKSANILVKYDPVTGNQTPLVNYSDGIRCFASNGVNTLIATREAFLFYDINAALTNEYSTDVPIDFVQIAGDTAVVGSVDSATVRILKAIDLSACTLFNYDHEYRHDEARLNADGSKIMLFSAEGFRIYDASGAIVCDTVLSGQIKDQQYRRDDGESWLEVTYYNGTVEIYSGDTGELIREELVENFDKSLDETFVTDEYKIVAPLHGAPEVYSLKTGKLVCTINEDGYLAYIQQVGQYIAAQYISDGRVYGKLMDGQLNVLADLPCLCDIKDGALVFDYPNGKIRTSPIYDVDELMAMGEKYLSENR